MIEYIGDISKADALVLKELAENATAILEFGCGASTQVMSVYTKNRIISIDTSQEWIDKTIGIIHLLNIKNEPSFYLYNEYFDLINSCSFDLIFNDGVNTLRREFALRTWQFLKVGGIMAFHDTRRQPDAENVTVLLNKVYNEVNNIQCNYQHSNITLIRKKEKELWQNWQIVEEKAYWQLGRTPIQDISNKIK